MSYLPDRHPLLKRMASVEHDGVKTDWIPRDQFETVVEERDRLRRALALVNVGVRIHDDRVPVDPGKVLDGVGETLEQARATASVMLGIREG